MDNPFPGMDPYLERRWGDFHHRIITYSCDQIQPRLPRDLRAQIQERIVIGPPGRVVGEFYPDVHVAETSRGAVGGPATTAVAEEVDVAEPLVVPTARRRPEGFIEIVETGKRQR